MNFSVPYLKADIVTEILNMVATIIVNYKKYNCAHIGVRIYISFAIPVTGL